MSHDPSSDEWTDEWSAEERELFRRLPREKEPPPALEERLVTELRRRGLLTPVERPWVRPLLQTAAAVLLVICGVLLGRWSGVAGPEPGGEPDRGPQFLLLLYEPPAWDQEAEAERVEEYGAWARGIAGQGRSVTGAPLGPARRALVPGGGTPGETGGPGGEPEGLTLGGYFLIGAADFDSAVKVAESCPHLRHGGTIVVRPLRREP